jgi:hypothetical protein
MIRSRKKLIEVALPLIQSNISFLLPRAIDSVVARLEEARSQRGEMSYP